MVLLKMEVSINIMAYDTLAADTLQAHLLGVLDFWGADGFGAGLCQ